MADLITFCAKFSAEDYALLEACAAAEKLRRADIVRRAVRAYAAQLGVKAPPERKKKRTK